MRDSKALMTVATIAVSSVSTNLKTIIDAASPSAICDSVIQVTPARKNGTNQSRVVNPNQYIPNVIFVMALLEAYRLN